MENLYDYFVELIGYQYNSAQNSNIILACCVCVIVLFVFSLKLISRGFDRLFGYNIIR